MIFIDIYKGVKFPDVFFIFCPIRSPLVWALDKVLVEKPMFVQVGSICTSNLSSGTALQQDFVIRKVGHDEHFGCRPLCLIFFICNHKSFTAHHFPRDHHDNTLRRTENGDPTWCMLSSRRKPSPAFLFCVVSDF